MRLPVFILALLLFGCAKEARVSFHIPSAVDSLSTDLQVQNFIRNNDTNFRRYEVKAFSQFNRENSYDHLNRILARQLGVRKNFEKLDFDGNGLTDFWVSGDDHSCATSEGSCSFSPLLVMNFGKNDIRIVSLTGWRSDAVIPKFEKRDTTNVLALYHAKFLSKTPFDRGPEKSTLVYKFRNMVEYNPKPVAHKIRKIEYSTSGCFGTCPVYELVLQRDSVSTFRAQYYNFSERRNITYGKEEGMFTVQLTNATFSEITQILNYLNFPDLKEDYSVNHTCDQTATLKITYDDNQVKTIEDYGLVGTYGLQVVYQKLADLRFNQKWQKK